MSAHNQKQFKYFTKPEMDRGLSMHGLPANTPSQLSDVFRAGADWAMARYHTAETVPKQHNFYTTQDADRPASICDRNGEVVLSLCKDCGRAEVELTSRCSGRLAVYCYVRGDEDASPVELPHSVDKAIAFLDAAVDREYGAINVVSGSSGFNSVICYGLERKQEFLDSIRRELTKYYGESP